MAARNDVTKRSYVRISPARWHCARAKEAKSGARLIYYSAAIRHTHRAVATHRRVIRRSQRAMAADAELLYAFLCSLHSASPSSERALHKEIALGTAIGFLAALLV